jgi:toxin YoeB
MTRPKKRRPIFDEGFKKDLDVLGRAGRSTVVPKILDLVESACEDHAGGIGKPEALSGDFAGFWSRRIDRKNRLIYRPTNGEIEFHQALGHYR